MNGNEIKIAVIDTGVKVSHPFFTGRNTFSGLSMLPQDGNIIVKKNAYEDTDGHGTAVNAVLDRYIAGTHIINIKIAENSEEEVEEQSIIQALSYIANEIYCDIIVLSCGVVMCQRLNELKALCDRITQRGSILIAAFDNDGMISYPAALPNVIGVDIHRSCRRLSEYFVIEGGIVDITHATKYRKDSYA